MKYWTEACQLHLLHWHAINGPFMAGLAISSRLCFVIPKVYAVRAAILPPVEMDLHPYATMGEARGGEATYVSTAR